MTTSSFPRERSTTGMEAKSPAAASSPEAMVRLPSPVFRLTEDMSCMGVVCVGVDDAAPEQRGGFLHQEESCPRSQSGTWLSGPLARSR